MRMPDNYTLSDVLFNRSVGDLAPAAPVDPALVFGPQRDSLLIVIPITIMYTAIFVMGLLGNVFTCIVIIRNKSMHTATNYYLFSLAISDLLLLVSGMPQEMYSIWYKWPYVFGSAFCLMRGLAAETSTNASILTITLFTVERYLAICHPFQSHKMSKLSRATKHVVLLWVVSLTLALPQALQFGIRTHIGVVMCLQTRVIIEHSFEISTFVFFLTPIVVITVLYFLIGLRLNETNRGRVHKDFESGEVRSMNKMSKRHSQSTRRVVKMLVAVVVAFFICWAPFHAQRLVAIYGTNENHLARSPNLLFVYSILTYTSGVFYYVSTCINPILYHIMCSKFRVAFKALLFRTRWCGVAACAGRAGRGGLARRWCSLGCPRPAEGPSTQVISLLETRRPASVKRHQMSLVVRPSQSPGNSLTKPSRGPKTRPPCRTAAEPTTADTSTELGRLLLDGRPRINSI
ncbi:pyrokinin-1 receptor isoform X2 [Plutella xylostella]|uniref:pyrokinin-1 receptor isoform X2 n=1 Tax=Plutella xylostella TaxID=51655 RepID=UPI002032254A|nr:pyrokinin-1 receptor isoform X2 [Plutella xylostella]